MRLEFLNNSFLRKFSIFCGIFVFLMFISVLIFIKVNAETFSGNLLPYQSGYALGNSSYPWSNINNAIYFNGSNVGIGSGVPSANARLQVENGNLYIDNGDGLGRGIIIKASDGSCWKWTPQTGTGAVVPSLVSPCP